MNKSTLFLASAASALFLTSAAMAEETYSASDDNITIEQASQYLRYSGGNDRMRVEIAPNYSEDLGWSLKGAAGSYLTDEIALGLIVEYGENKREYLANAGIQFSDALSFVGTVGMLEEHNEYVDGDGREVVQQMEYGASFKGAYEVGIISGFELNGYLADANTDADTVETGRLYGAQLLADFDLTSTTHLKLGGGYEWLAWDDGDNNDSFAFSAEGKQQLGDMLSINGNASVGASENVYGGGLALDLSRGGANTNRIGLNYSYIDGKNGIEDDQRVELGWTYGFGAGPTQMASVETRDAGAIRPVADVATVAPANNLLGDVMKRPAYLPQTVIARAKAVDGDSSVCHLADYLYISSIFDGGTYTQNKWIFVKKGSETFPNGATWTGFVNYISGGDMDGLGNGNAELGWSPNFNVAATGYGPFYPDKMVAAFVGPTGFELWYYKSSWGANNAYQSSGKSIVVDGNTDTNPNWAQYPYEEAIHIDVGHDSDIVSLVIRDGVNTPITCSDTIGDFDFVSPPA